MDYNCQHCGANLDDGDIFECFLLKYGDPVKARECARGYGWSETNKKHFKRSMIIQCENAPQYTICPDCKQKDPFIIRPA
jgi:hypothetical protein